MGNHAGRNLGRPVESALQWPDVLRAVPRPETRVWLLARFRDRGFDADSFAFKMGRVAMAEALTATEDWLELEHPRWKEDRALLKLLRRVLEIELWP